MSYDTTLGRWIETDPIGYPDGANRYDFERGNPQINVDPFGTSSFSNLRVSLSGGRAKGNFYSATETDGKRDAGNTDFDFDTGAPQSWHGSINSTLTINDDQSGSVFGTMDLGGYTHKKFAGVSLVADQFKITWCSNGNTINRTSEEWVTLAGIASPPGIKIPRQLDGNYDDYPIARIIAGGVEDLMGAGEYYDFVKSGFGLIPHGNPANTKTAYAQLGLQIAAVVASFWVTNPNGSEGTQDIVRHVTEIISQFAS